MSETLKEALSAVVDDEADEFELRRVLDELDKDAELRGLWSRYHLVGSVLRGERPTAADTLRERVWNSLEQDLGGAEPALRDASGAARASAPAAARPGWLGPRLGVAVAASVALAVVLGIAMTGETENPAGPALVQTEVAPLTSGTPVLVEQAVAPAGDLRLARDVSPSDLRRARAYMLYHTQHQALNQAGVVNFVKMATYEGQ